MTITTHENTPIIRPLAHVMKENYLDYAMSVITDRALPDARDGLKPVHRRILYAMHSLGIGPNSPYKKSARVVGEVIGKYHPHGDSAAYDAAVRLAQPWSMQHPLIDGQGNFGSIDGDSAAAMRYTEMRMSKMGAKLFTDIGKNTVDFRENFDGTEHEPVVLPCAYPQLWVNGCEGIAVGMATSIPPHNLNETAAAFLAWMENPHITVGEIAGHIPAPDFPTGGIVHGLSGYRQALETGSGKVKLRSRWATEERRQGQRLVITEIPYLVNKAKLVESIGTLVQERKVEGIVDLRDESNKRGIRIVVDVKKGHEPELIMMQLMALTSLEVTISYNVMALLGMDPKQMGIRDVFQAFYDHRIEVIQRRTQFDLDKVLERLHMLEGFLAALDRLDDTIRTIRDSADPSSARTALEQLLGIDAAQAQAILDMKLQRLTGLQIQEIRDEHTKLSLTVVELRDILSSRDRQRDLLRDELNAVRDAHGQPRRTEIIEEMSSITNEDLIPQEDVLLIATQAGYVKRIPISAMKKQNRGTRGRSVVDVGNDDFVTAIHHTSSHDYLFAVTDEGQVHCVKAWEIPESGLGTKGRHYRNVFSGLDGTVVAMLSASDIEDESQSLVIVTSAGLVKRTLLSEFMGAKRSGGVRGITLNDGDEIVAARISQSDADNLLIVGSGSKAIRFSMSEARPIGRTGRGVRGIKLASGHRVLAASIVTANDVDSSALICIGSMGVGKKTPVTLFPLQGRGGSGVTCFGPIRRSGDLAAAAVIFPAQDLVIFNENGGANRVTGDDVPATGRAAAGASIIRNGTVKYAVAVPASPQDDNEDDEPETH
ncbi:MAG: DNA gyrase subunit A [Oceanicaulis sp.]|nr:DNA gyrase subunit A [Oceanicaulis sp.]